MLFNSLLFLFGFLPLVLLGYFLLPKLKLKNIFLLIASLFFYAWGEGVIVLVMLFSILFNYGIGSVIFNFGKPKFVLFTGVAVNLAILVYYKYAYFIAENLSGVGIEISIPENSIILPIGISFYTFQSISYLVDVYRKTVPPQKNPIDLGLYISLFPQLIAGPIVRYEDIRKEIAQRKVTTALFAEGIMKFIRGLAKKVIIANNVALIADKTFDIPTDDLGTMVSWLGIVCYALQIYFDFSGYSDMAIGLGKMFGFNIKENFLHPYRSTSIKEFWRRWHISLSTWFRDYVYIPLGGSKGSKLNTYRNLILVFFITGLWHGASWNFIVWGLFHGMFLLLERSINFNLPKGLSFIKHIYLLLVVLVGWVLFRADTLTHAVGYIESMFVFSNGFNNYPFIYMNAYTLLIIMLGVVFSMPLRNSVIGISGVFIQNKHILTGLSYTLHFAVLFYSLVELVQSNYNPFIYFRF